MAAEEDNPDLDRDYMQFEPQEHEEETYDDPEFHE
jgi:hypothetical protein